MLNLEFEKALERDSRMTIGFKAELNKQRQEKTAKKALALGLLPRAANKAKTRNAASTTVQVPPRRLSKVRD